MRFSVAGLVFLGLPLIAASVPANITFHKEVLPVLQKNCQSCHRPGEAAPMSFLTYKDTRPWAKAIKQAVATKRMPPWFADPHVGKFANDRSLSAADAATLIAWADSGAKEGDPKDAKPNPQWVEGWQIGNPDLVLEMPNEFTVPESGTIDYQYIVIPTHTKEDKWIQAAEARPGNRAVVHHIIAFIREPGSKWMKEAVPGVPFVPSRNGRGNASAEGGNGLGGDNLTGYAPGMPASILEPGKARLLKAGSDIVLQMHYTADGKKHTDKSRIGLVFAKEPPRERVQTLAASTMRFAIPPGAPNHRVDASITLHSPTTLVGMLPHMHLRGKAFSYRAVYPDGRTEDLLNVPRYDFNWQLWYLPAGRKELPAGTKIECSAWYDNSPNNPANPDPAKEVRFGEQSWEEMMFGFFDIAYDMKTDLRDILRPKQQPAPAQTRPSSSGAN